MEGFSFAPPDNALTSQLTQDGHVVPSESGVNRPKRLPRTSNTVTSSSHQDQASENAKVCRRRAGFMTGSSLTIDGGYVA
jgi:hypothetical protein